MDGMNVSSLDPSPDARGSTDDPATQARWQQATADAGAAPQAASGSAPARTTAAPADAAASATASVGPQMGDLGARQDMAAKLVKPGKGATSEDMKVVQDHLVATMPLQEMQTLKDNGTSFRVTEGSVGSLLPAGVANTPARDHTNGDTNGSLSGLFYPPGNEVLIATHAGADGQRQLPGVEQSASADVLLHEAGHALNETNLFSANQSNTESFKKAYTADTSSSQPNALGGEYYHQTAHPAAGRDEAFAESHAEFLTNPAQLQAQNPHIYQWWQQNYGGQK